MNGASPCAVLWLALSIGISLLLAGEGLFQSAWVDRYNNRLNQQALNEACSPPREARRMLPAISKMFILNNLLAGTLYDLCVVAIYDDAATSLTATHILGCLQFSTDDEYIRCSSLPGDFIGGTMIIIIGGIIVFSLLVFIIILMIRYRVCAGDQTRKVSGNGGNNESWPLDLGQPGPSQLLRFQSDLSRATDEPLSRPCQRSHQALLTQWPEKDPPQICAEKGLDPEQQEQQLQESRRHRFSCRLIVQDESQPSSEASTRSQSFASSHYFHDSRDGPLVALGGSSKVQPSLSVWEKQGPWVAIDQPGWPEQREQGSEEEEGEEEDDEVEEEEEGEEEEEQEGDGRNQQCTNLASQSRQTGISQGDTELALSKVLFTSANSGPRRSLSFDINVLSHRESFNKAKASLQPKRSLSINGLVVCFEETRPSNGLTYAGSEWMPESSV